MRVVAIIQARMGSARLPGKVLAEIGGRSMLRRVCGRAAQAARIDQLLVATTMEPDDEAIVDECARLQVACFRGSTDDLLDRYHKAARAYRADAVVRITADCPLIDPQVIDLVVDALKKRGQDPFSYASNTLRRTWPRGLDTEAMTAAALSRACREATEPYQRTHVTPYIYRHPESFRLLAVTLPSAGHRNAPPSRRKDREMPSRMAGREDLGRWRWTVDLPEDLDFVRAVYRRLADDETFSWRDVQRLLAREPALAELNRHVRQRELVEG